MSTPAGNPPGQPQDVPFQPFPPLQHVFTPVEMGFIRHLMTTTPTGFLKGSDMSSFDANYRMLGMAAMALTHLNYTNPTTQWSLATLPKGLQPLVILGTQYYMMLMMQAGFALIDINYNDNGFSLSIDRSAKIAAAADKVMAQWEKQVLEVKRGVMLHAGGIGLGTPRYNSNVGRMMSMLGDGAFSWGLP